MIRFNKLLSSFSFFFFFFFFFFLFIYYLFIFLFLLNIYCIIIGSYKHKLEALLQLSCAERYLDICFHGDSNNQWSAGVVFMLNFSQWL